jgi:hypothetical protein
MSQEDFDQQAQAAGVPQTEQVFENYYGFSQTHIFELPDGVQFIEFQTLSEGGKAKFQEETSSDITLRRSTGDASIRATPSRERHALLTASVTGWHMLRPKPGAVPPFTRANMQPVTFSKGTPGSEFEKWLQVADPKLIERLETAIRKANPWLLGEMKSEDIKEEIARLEEMYQTAVEREQGEGLSSDK